VFVDESGINTVMVRQYGWGPCGERVPQGHWETATLVLAVRQAGLAAPMVTAGAMNGALFLADVKTFLCPILVKGDIVIWDNLCVHQVAGVREAIDARGATLQPLPPDSPDINPIEQVFSKLKAQLRAAAERTVEGLWKTLGTLLDEFPPDECANFLKGAGYAVQAN
jgi:transposase